MIVLDYQDRRPIYEQVTDKFQILILNGVLLPGSQMPSVRQLATELSVNPNTIQRAYRELEAEGYIVSMPGKGSFACERGADDSARRRELLRLMDAVAAELRWLGVTTEELCRRLEGGNDSAEN